MNKFLDFLNQRDREEENPYENQTIEIATIDESVDEIDSKAVIPFSDLAIDLDKFEGFSDDKIVEHLRRVGKLATDGQLKEVIGMHPTYPFEGSHEELADLYVDHTMKTIAKLRAF